jgi:hypothetical protein
LVTDAIEKGGTVQEDRKISRRTFLAGAGCTLVSIGLPGVLVRLALLAMYFKPFRFRMNHFFPVRFTRPKAVFKSSAERVSSAPDSFTTIMSSISFVSI